MVTTNLETVSIEGPLRCHPRDEVVRMVGGQGRKSKSMTFPWVRKDCGKYRPTMINLLTSNTVKKRETVELTTTVIATVNGERATVLYDTGCSCPALVFRW